MSLLADLLSKIKHQDQQGSVPPDLARIIQRSSQKKKVERKFLILLVIILLFVIAGFGAIYFFESYLTSPSTGVARQDPALRDTRRDVSPAPPATPQPPVSPHTQQTAQSPSPPEVRPEPKIPPQKEAKALPAEVQAPRAETTSRATETKQDRYAAPAGPRTSRPSKKASVSTENLKAERDLLIYSAGSFEQNKNYSRAVTDYKKALQKDPGNYLIMNSLASVLIRTGAFEESIRYSEQALIHQKNYVPALINLGIAHIQNGNMTEGEACLTKARSIEPANRAALLNLALLYERLPNLHESFTHFQKLSEMRDIRGFLGMARILEKQGNRIEAEKIYRNILTMDEVDPQTRQFAHQRLLAIGDR